MSLQQTEITIQQFADMISEARPGTVRRTVYANFTVHEFLDFSPKPIVVIEGASEDYVMLS